LSVEIRKVIVQVTETHAVPGRALEAPVRQAVASGVLRNPFAGRYEEDVTPLVDLGAEVAALLADRALAALGPGVQVTAYGKGRSWA
jgi:hypothetical protein